MARGLQAALDPGLGSDSAVAKEPLRRRASQGWVWERDTLEDINSALVHILFLQRSRHEIIWPGCFLWGFLTDKPSYLNRVRAGERHSGDYLIVHGDGYARLDWVKWFSMCSLEAQPWSYHIFLPSPREKLAALRTGIGKLSGHPSLFKQALPEDGSWLGGFILCWTCHRRIVLQIGHSLCPRKRPGVTREPPFSRAGGHDVTLLKSYRSLVWECPQENHWIVVILATFLSALVFGLRLGQESWGFSMLVPLAICRTLVRLPHSASSVAWCSLSFSP